MSGFSSRLTLSRYDLDRDHLTRRRPTLWDDLWADPATRVLPVSKGRALLAAEARLAFLPPSEVPDGLKLYLGRTTSHADGLPAGAPLVAVDLDEAAAAGLAGEWGDLRALGPRLGDLDAGAFTEALGMFNWHRSHGFSPRSGQPTTPADGGWTRIDPADGSQVFPRTDAAIIVGVVDDDDRILLGSNAAWQNNRWSILAGFVEPGESLESAVAREVMEESGVRVHDARYLGSQPWPFPASLMLGYTARVHPEASGELEPDGDEILDLRWFSRDELRASLESILLPGPVSIAHAIIERWYGEPLTQPEPF